LGGISYHTLERRHGGVMNDQVNEQMDEQNKTCDTCDILGQVTNGNA
jgi:hypothetical protein